MVSGEAMNSNKISVATEAETTVTSPKRLARIAGVLYLLVGIFGGFAQGLVYPRVYVPGDATSTTANVLANADLIRVGVVADLFQATVFVFLAIVLYRLLKHVNRSVAGAMVVLVAIAAGVTCLSAVLEFEAQQVATGAVNLGTFGAAGSSGMVLLLVDTHNYSLLAAQIFFGLWLAPLGYLAYKSGWFPRALGAVLVAGCVSYLVDTLAAYLVPDVSSQIHSYLSILPAIAEVWMVGYLLVIGVKSKKVTKPEKSVPAAIATV
jgi:hypothetical protein